MSKDIRKRVEKWANEVGERIAQGALVSEGASPNTAQKLTGGYYPHEPGPLLEGAITRAMAKEGPKQAS